MAELRIALAQVTGVPYAAEENRALSVRTARAAFDDGASLVVLPELIVSGYAADAARLREIAEPLDGPTVAAWQQLAADAGGVVVGGFCEREEGRLYNAAVAVTGEGPVLHYRKLHPFREEKHAFTPGDRGLPVVQLPFGTIGICVCYDLRFVETVRALALQGAQLVCVPTAWVPGFDQQRWDAEGYAPQARGALLQSNLSQVFIACASQAGPSGDYDFLGSSLVADPRGKALLGPFPGSKETLAAVDVDLAEAERAQTRDPLIRPRADRRTDVYGLVVNGRVY
ncbi:MAG TPA: nitrilase-related carbon-nitrogen hydrolase [Conexibacter sp.]|jgi:predicted amidohydrolase